MSQREGVDHKRFGVWSAVSFLTTLIVEIVIFDAAAELPHSSFGFIGIFFITLFVLVVGCITNAVAGFRARRRNEYWGGWIAAAGIALWMLSIFVLPGLFR